MNYVHRVETRLKGIRNFADGPVDAWDARQVPWFATLIVPIKNGGITLADIENGDSESCMDQNLFVDWLVLMIIA